MKLGCLRFLRNFQTSNLKCFKMEKYMSSITTNPVQTCNKDMKNTRILKESPHKFDSGECNVKTAFAKESKMLMERKCNNDDEETRSSILSAILSDALGETLISDNTKKNGSCAKRAIRLAGSNKRKQLDKAQSSVESEQVSKTASSTRPFTVSIEGNIGSGKSTFLKHFAAMPMVATHQEPLGKWTDVGGYNLLGKLYEDPKRWSFLFQSYVQLTRLHIHLQRDENTSVKLIERSLQNNRYCFVESGHDSGDLHSSEYDVLCEYFDTFNDNLDLGVDLIVYLRSSPEVVHQRMQKRGRAEEAGVPLTYLQKLHAYYERWLIEGKPCPPPAPVLVIDANSDLLSVTRSINLHQHYILGQKAFHGSMKNIESEQKENRDPLEEKLECEKQKNLKKDLENTTGTNSKSN